MRKTLYKIKQGSIIAGVCMGISEYFDIDVNIVRLLFIITSFGGGFGLVAYIAAAILLPEAP